MKLSMGGGEEQQKRIAIGLFAVLALGVIWYEVKDTLFPATTAPVAVVSQAQPAPARPAASSKERADACATNGRRDKFLPAEILPEPFAVRKPPPQPCTLVSGSSPAHSLYYPCLLSGSFHPLWRISNSFLAVPLVFLCASPRRARGLPFRVRGMRCRAKV